MVTIDEEEYFAHYGTPRHSGRYPWGTTGWGEGDTADTTQRNMDILDHIEEMRSKGLTDTEIAKGMGMSTTDFRAQRSIAKAEMKLAQIDQARRLSDRGNSNKAIAERMGLSGESYVRSLLKPGAEDKANAIFETSNVLKKAIEEKGGYLDVGTGVENYLQVSKEKLNTAISILKQKFGFDVVTVPVPQMGTQHDTQHKVLVPPGVTQREVFMNRDKIVQLIDFKTDDGGRSWAELKDPIPVDPDRVDVVWGPDGGAKKDGVIYVRPGAKDLSLGKNNYAQVRVKVGDKHYVKGMAMYKDDLPEGVDLQVNTPKENTGDKYKAMKLLTDNPELPFGSIVNQIVDDEGKVTSAMNLIYEEGDWTTWSNTLSSQVLSKQSPKVAKELLDLRYKQRQDEYDEIMALTNPTVKRKLLETLASSADSSAVHLEAAKLPRQAWYPILPITSLKDNEVYAPGYNNGERVALVRHPHGGTFEIPDLRVNNKNPEGRKLLGDARDAIGINANVAQRLSGADYDGDTVLVIPNEKGKIKISAALEDLKDFDPMVYKLPEDSPIKRMDKTTKQREMGAISNLITDMTIQNAPHSEIARAVRHSMVVIDAEKHELNYKESARRNAIAALKKEYQGKTNAGASTLISRAGAETRILDRKPRPQSEGGPIDKDTGELRWVPTGKTRTDRQGNVVPKKIKSKKLAETTDAYDLVSDPSGTPIEKIYADHSNKLKALANKARLSMLDTPRLKRDPSAKKAYSKEVASLNSKLAIAQMAKPRERQAQVIGNASYRTKIQANPNLDDEAKQRLRFSELEKARARMGARKTLIEFTDREWDAIQAGAVSDTQLDKMLKNADLDRVRELATPREKLMMTTPKTTRAKRLLAQGYTRSEVAQQLGVSVSTLDNSIKEEGAYE